MNANEGSSLDDHMRLEAVYLSAPVPRTLSALTVMGVVFDRIHFPGVYLPKGDLDVAELDREIKRIAALDAPRRHDDGLLLGVLTFAQYARTLRGFCVLEDDPSATFNNKVPEQLVSDFYQAVHGPFPENWHPIFDSACTKGIPGGDCIAYPGQYHYLATALRHSDATGLPLVNDVPGLPLPTPSVSRLRYDPKLMSAMIAIECVTLILPEIPLLTPEVLMQFREENSVELRRFRRSLFSFSGELGQSLVGVPHEELDDALRSFIQTHILPSLAELEEKMKSGSRSWFERAVEAVAIAPEVVPTVLSLDPASAIASTLVRIAPSLLVPEVKARIEHHKLRTNGLYYLLKVRALGRRA